MLLLEQCSLFTVDRKIESVLLEVFWIWTSRIAVRAAGSFNRAHQIVHQYTLNS